MLKPIIKSLAKPIQKLTIAFRRQSLLERRQKQMETLIQQRQAKGLSTKTEELHKENIGKELKNLEVDIVEKIGRLNKDAQKNNES